jgi:hypothetical protein
MRRRSTVVLTLEDRALRGKAPEEECAAALKRWVVHDTVGLLVRRTV